MKRPILRFALAVVLQAGSCIFAQSAGGYPPPKVLGDPAQRGQGIQRTMSLLASSSPQRRNTVRILFYGQSITEQEWWKAVAEDLKHRFPHANLLIENRALGGFSSQRLVKTAETDLYSFYPDLMIFHVYGAHTQYEDIIRRTRQRTTAEILIQTDHATADADHTEETDPAKLSPNGRIWNSFMNYRFLPETARKYGCGLVDQRNLWKQYLKDYQLPARQLLRDSVHLNAHGNYLMAELVKACLVSRQDIRIDPMNCQTVRTFTVGKDLQWQDGMLALAFEGNRVDVVLGQGKATASVRIDGKRPSDWPELYGFTRALSKPGGKWPVVANLKSQAPLQLEQWTLQVKKDPANESRFTFALIGSKTGPDGQGRSDQRFVSNSRRIVFEPEDWDVAYALGLAGLKPPPAEFVVNWQVVPYFVDEVAPPARIDPAIESTVTLAQGLKNTRHTLEIRGGADAPIAALRVYRPPLSAP